MKPGVLLPMARAPGRTISFSLYQRLLAGFLLLLILVLAGAFFVIRYYVHEQVVAQARDQLHQAYVVAETLFSRYQDRLVNRAQLIVALPSLHRAVSSPDLLQALLQELRKTEAADVVWVTDSEGRVLATTGEPPLAGELWKTRPWVSVLQISRPLTAVTQLRDRWYLTCTMPIQAEGSSKAILILGLELDQAFLGRLVEVTRVRIALRTEVSVLSSPGWPEDPRIVWPASPLYGVPKLVPHHSALVMVKQVPFALSPLDGKVEMAFLREIDQALVRRVGITLAWVGLFMLLFGTTVALRVVRSVTEPIKQLVEVTRQVASGDLAPRAEIVHRDEVGELVMAFNQMLDRLQQSYDQLAKLNATLEARVRERTRALEEAQAQLVQKEKLASLGQLAAGVAHELNNPLMAVLGSIQLVNRSIQHANLARDELARINELVEVVEREAFRGKRIVSNLLDFARIKTPMKGSADLHKLIDGAAFLVSHQVKMDEVTVEREYQPGMPPVTVDPDQITQVLVNVILNAVQAIQGRGRVILRTALEHHEAVVEIQDTGMGISQELLSKVFDPFFTTKEVGQGTGLGLAVSYGIIQEHGGRIQIASTERAGTTVTIRLPLERESTRSS